MPRLMLAVVALLLATLPLPAADPVVLEQVVSRHDPHFDVARARLSVGQDGYIYLANSGGKGGYVLRVSPDGRERSGGVVGYSTQAVAASKDGTVATAEGHFAHRVAFWGKNVASLGHVPDFLVSDIVQWNAPSDVCAGPSGDFYGIDQHRLRVLRVTPPNKLAEAYSLEQTGEKSRGGTLGLRVDESHKRFVTAWSNGMIWVTSFDGKPLWSLKLRPAGETPGGFDLDAEGKLYIIAGGTDVKIFGLDGKPAGEVKLKVDPTRKAQSIHDLRLLGDQFIIKRDDSTTLFEVYDRKSGELVRKVAADVEILQAKYPSSVWIAGKPVPFEIKFDAGMRPTKPSFRVWMRPLGVPEFTELPVRDGALAIPDEFRGLYQLRVTPDIGGRVAEYVVDGFVEVRTPDAKGSVSIFTPLNRFYYGAGEEIPVTVVVRVPPKGTPTEKLTVKLRSLKATLREWPLELKNGKAEFTVSRKELEAIPPGRYTLDAELTGFTVAPQYIEVGPGLQQRPRFHILQHGDYSFGFPTGPRPYGLNVPRLIDSPDTVAVHIARSRKLGLNLFVDRLGNGSGLGLLSEIGRDDALLERLKTDPLAVAPEKAQFEGSARRAIAGYGAFGIEEQGILLYMDAGLPVGTLFDSRKPEQMDKDLEQANKQLLTYPALRGWSWAANWWLEKHGASAAKDPSEKAAYEAALKRARETGEWSPILDTISDRTFAHAVDAEKRFRAKMNAIVSGKLSAMTGPYRAIQTHPPIIFANADEVDLQYQAEQIQPPQVTPHNVDYYKRPGKPAWGHPELWNDDGTGGMICPTLLQMVMRGANGVGQSGGVGPWASHDPGQSDPRCAAAGTTSAYRALYALLRQYGPWLATLENADRVAIVVSTRMVRIETWDGKIGSAYFDSLFEAYSASMYAHRPASFVFVEDLKPDTLKKYQAILVVSQRVELDPPLASALKQAQAAGIKVYSDGTSQPELVKNFTPLGVSFDRVKQDPHAWQDDAAYSRFPQYFKTHAEQLRKVLAPVVRPVAECDNPEIMLTELRSGESRFIWAVNNTMLGWDPGLAWRLSLQMTHRVPMVEKLKLDVPPGWSVFEVFSRKPVKHDNGVVTCDLRTVPARLYALVPPTAKPFDPVPDGMEADSLFGPHVRSLALSTDGKTALLNCFNWDHNLYGLNLETGETQWRGKVGHGFAFDPGSTERGFTVQGFDVFSGEGYHLYTLGADGKPTRRFALFGLPKRATGWASGSQLQDVGINNFTTAPDGSWVASSGDLGLVVWDRDGQELWSDAWWKATRKRVRLVAVDNQTLLVLDGTTAIACDARTGQQVWTLPLADSGTLLGGTVSADRKTIVLRADTLGGRLFVIRAGKLVNTILTPADEIALATDGSLIAATDGHQLKVFDPLEGLLWTFTGDDTLRHPCLSPDGKRIAVGSELGTLTIVNRTGGIEAERDLGSLPVPSWLSNDELVIATWMGKVLRADAKLNVKWSLTLTPTETDARSKLLAKDLTPTVRKSNWGNAAATGLPLTPNLLAESKAMIMAVSDPRTHGDPRPWQNKAELLMDGKPDAPPKPWLEWTDIGYIDSGWRNKLALEVDTFRTQLRVTAVTFVEDPNHPESWLRDMRMQWWDASAEQWRDGPYLLSDTATHTHVFDKPIEAARFRFVSTGGGTWPIGNIRLGELVFHGEVLGCSHPDAVAKNAVAVLFDEKETDLTVLKYPGRPFSFRYGGAYSGGKCLELSAAGETGPAWQPPFGHAVPNWDFEIAEDPKPGQYRYLQFAWKATSEKTTGVGILLSGLSVIDGDAKWREGVRFEHKLNGTPSTEWTTVRVDLWALTKGKPPRIQALSIMAKGGGALFDQILLGRTSDDLDKVKPLK